MSQYNASPGPRIARARALLSTHLEMLRRASHSSCSALSAARPPPLLPPRIPGPFRRGMGAGAGGRSPPPPAPSSNIRSSWRPRCRGCPRRHGAVGAAAARPRTGGSRGGTQKAEAGVAVDDIEIRKADLEDVFLDVMSGASATTAPMAPMPPTEEVQA